MRCLAIALNRIQRPVLTTKCCNNLLPTALSLFAKENTKMMTNVSYAERNKQENISSTANTTQKYLESDSQP